MTGGIFWRARSQLIKSDSSAGAAASFRVAGHGEDAAAGGLQRDPGERVLQDDLPVRGGYAVSVFA